MLLHVLDLCGVAVFAISGVASARRVGMDIFGILVIAVITALGGGTLRDLLLGRHPVFWLDDAAYLAVISATVAATLVYVRWWPTPTQLLYLADTGGLALFTVGGTQAALALGTAWHAAIIMGMLSGCAGGILRDVLCGEVPYILRREVYATAALAGAGLLHPAPTPGDAGASLGPRGDGDSRRRSPRDTLAQLAPPGLLPRHRMSAFPSLQRARSDTVGETPTVSENPPREISCAKIACYFGEISARLATVVDLGEPW